MRVLVLVRVRACVRAGSVRRSSGRPGKLQIDIPIDL